MIQRKFWTWEKHDTIGDMSCYFKFVFVVDMLMCYARKGCWLSRRESVVCGTSGESQERKEFGKREQKGKEGEKVVWGKRVSFCFCVTVSFTPSFPPFSTHHATTLLPTLSLTTVHTTPLHTHHTTPMNCLPSQPNIWASVKVPTNSVPTTQSLKRGGDCCAMTSSQGAALCLLKKECDRVHVEWWWQHQIMPHGGWCHIGMTTCEWWWQLPIG